jgi:hypothetical protein
MEKRASVRFSSQSISSAKARLADLVEQADVVCHKSALATEPLPSRIHEQREHHQPRDNG